MTTGQWNHGCAELLYFWNLSSDDGEGDYRVNTKNLRDPETFESD
jgi:hypothetical protein